MIKKILTELIYFFVILFILALMQHSDLLSSPMTRVELMTEKQNYLHPMLWSAPVYIIVATVRVVIKYIVFLKNRSKK